MQGHSTLDGHRPSLDDWILHFCTYINADLSHALCIPSLHFSPTMDSKAVLVVLLLLIVGAYAKDPFSYVNEGEMGYYTVEYNSGYRPVPLASQPGAIFQMLFFNTTPNAYTLGIRMGNHNKAETMRIVWTANTNRPVPDGSTLNFTADGNFALFHADGTLVWSTNTANMGVVGIELRTDGNLVLFDSHNRGVWQSFDHPTDTLLVEQSLKADGVKKLVSRASEKDGSEGPYSFVMEAGGFALYAALPTPLPYNTLSYYDNKIRDLYSITHACKRPLASITFLSDPDADNGFPLMMEMRLANSTAPPSMRAPKLCSFDNDQTSTALYSFATPRFNTTLSFMRLDWDGNLRMYTYSPQIEYNTWDITYERFKSGGLYGCGLPKKCGSFGVCGDSQCVACPQPKGLQGWSTSCSPPSLPACNSTTSVPVDFYKVLGAEHFTSKYVAGIGKLNVGECRKRCLSDCKCAAFFYWQESSTCFLTQSVETLQQSGNSTHLAFIKYPKKV